MKRKLISSGLYLIIVFFFSCLFSYFWNGSAAAAFGLPKVSIEESVLLLGAVNILRIDLFGFLNKVQE